MHELAYQTFTHEFTHVLITRLLRFGLHCFLEMPQILESDQTRVQVFMHDHTVSHLLGVASEGYQQNARFEKSPEIAPLSSPSGLVECLILLLQTSNPLRLGED